jgi:predicted aspartyl protease
VPGFALIDTGASVSAVDDSVVRQRGAQPVGIAQVGTAGGQHPQAVYPARLVFPGTNIPSVEFGQLLGANLAGQMVAGHQGPLIVLLGRDILQQFVLFYNGSTGSFTLAF